MNIAGVGTADSATIWGAPSAASQREVGALHQRAARREPHERAPRDAGHAHPVNPLFTGSRWYEP